MKLIPFLYLLPLVFFGCRSVEDEYSSEETLFTRLPASITGLHFVNQLEDSEDFDVFRYRNYYNGGGVGIGDINNDGLPDIYLTANRNQNRLFLNKGNFKFEDITVLAGVGGSKPWSTGVTIADVNGDGFLDIYVCNSGDIDGRNMENELFINNGNLTFTEKASEFGLADPGFTTHACFFDYDLDGDLDCYLLNNSFRPISTLGYRNLRNQRDAKGGDKLFKNENGKFSDVSEVSGIYGSVIGFGLGIGVGDINDDNYPDIFISNDFYERDYLYINQKDGTFKELLPEYMNHISMFSMGADIADINNDGYPEIFTTDMLPESDRRLKTTTAFETYDVHQLRLQNDYYFQYMRNTLQLNNGGENFSEIGYLANVAATDWSWGALIADFTNNGSKELFVSNGIYKDVTNQDFIAYLANDENMRAAIEGKKVDFQDFIKRMPSEKLSNYLFTQVKPLQFENKALEWGLGEPSFSNGAAYGDLDGDGDLDLVINNVNQELFVYRNNTERYFSENEFIAFQFEGYGKNPFALGTKVNLYADGKNIMVEHMPIRGFQSSMDYKMVIGLGKSPQLDSVVITWPDKKQQTLKNLKTNQEYQLNYSQAKFELDPANKGTDFLLTEISDFGTNYSHKENTYNDFDRERLTYQMLSSEGPAFDVTDLNADGLDDFFIGGAAGEPGCLFIQQKNGTFAELKLSPFQEDAPSEDVSAVFFNANNDGKTDLLVVSGGSEFKGNDLELKDRLYINQSKGEAINFVKSKDALPLSFNIGSVALAQDINGDGFMDLFIGSRKNKSYYGQKPSHQILINDGNGKFSDMTSAIMPDLQNIGMITHAVWINSAKGNPELYIVGDWEPIRRFQLQDGVLKEMPVSIMGMAETAGWWNKIVVRDLNGDQLPDLVIGNAGINNKFKPNDSTPVSLYVHDFDNNGSFEPIHAYQMNGMDYPVHTRHEMVMQMSSLKKKFQTFEEYAGKNMLEVFGEEELSKADVLRSYQAETVILINQGKGKFQKVPLPIESQFTQIRAIEILDINQDGHDDILLAGNFYDVKPEMGRFDASDGITLIGNGNGEFSYLPNIESGFCVKGQTRHLKKIGGKSENYLLAVRNNDRPILFKLK